MKQLNYFLLALIIFSTSCKNEPKIDKPNFDFNKTYAGKIDDKYLLHIKLNSDNGKINGSYFYDKDGTDIEIKGTIKSDSTITLNEFDQKGNQTGLWSGKLMNENKISGTWSKPNRDSEMDFILILTTDNYESSKKAISDSKFSKYNGTYHSPFNDYGDFFGQVIIKYTNNKEIDFKITVYNRDGCTGELEGLANIDSNGNAIYSGPGCKKLFFDFDENQVKLNETKCMLHGIDCFFDGVYNK